MLFSCERSSDHGVRARSDELLLGGHLIGWSTPSGVHQTGLLHDGALSPEVAARVLSKIDVTGPAWNDAEGPSGAEDRVHVNEAGDFTAGEIPVPIPNTEVKPRRADCTARESVWESRSSPT